MITNEFKSRIGVVELAGTDFVDRNGIWAKAPETAESLMYDFVDGHEGSMTYQEYLTLPADQKELIRHAPSRQAA